MKTAGRVLATIIGVLLLWFAITMAVSPALIVAVPKHGELPERITFEPTLVTEVSRYIAAALLGFFGLTLAIVPWRKKKPAPNGPASAGWQG